MLLLEFIGAVVLLFVIALGIQSYLEQGEKK